MMVLVFLCFPFRVVAETGTSDKPLWELGLLGGGVITSDYPGSNESELKGIAFPNFRYRGEIFRSDEEEGTRARVYDTPVYKIDLSFDFNFPVDSNTNAARKGMDDIDLVFEIGPRLKIRLADWQDSENQIFLLLPIRKGITTDFGYLGDAGWSFSPGLQFIRKKVFCDLCRFFFRVSASFLDTNNSELFYGVPSKDVLANRPAFQGKAGFNATEFFLGYILRIQKVQGFLGVIHSEFGGSVNSRSPLLVAGSNTTVILGVGWLFWESEKRGYE